MTINREDGEKKGLGEIEKRRREGKFLTSLSLVDKLLQTGPKILGGILLPN